MALYEPKDSSQSPRFTGPRTFMRLPYKEELDDNMDFVVTGIPFDTGASFRVGARFGPQAIRDFSILLRPFNVEQNTAIFDLVSGVDYGDLVVAPGYIKQSYERIVEQMLPIFNRGIIPIAMGGDHSITLAELRAAAQVYGPLALIQFDAHSDTWDSYFGEKYMHGTPFKRAVEEEIIDPSASIQIGIRGPLYDSTDLEVARELGFAVYSSEELFELGVGQMVDIIHERVKDRPVFVTFDIDFFDPVYAPGTGTPEVAGPSVRDGLHLIRGLKGLNIVGFDCVEVLPAFDPSQITAAAAANVMYEMITLVAINRRLKADTAVQKQKQKAI
ncbi:agmatinase [Caldalkalibacillus uzonensis]|uniref:Agmatinase n=1 Tax=Caldalkalibacillus uzonensis TaxID=353224 RepID=A0ABU0CNK2_9BACI|nr:agmatinase [Caldalkalibacillus uzonensis]MDQ0338001.1 agmatinase [Caldalkalibacillus uzonensis]